MNCFFGAYSDTDNDTVNHWFPTYVQWRKLVNVRNPSNYWVTLDEHADSINDGYFIIPPVTAAVSGAIPRLPITTGPVA